MKKKILIGIGVVVILFFLFIMIMGKPYKEFSMEQAVAWSTLKVSLAQSNYDGGGKIKESTLNQLKELTDGKGWFGDYDTIYVEEKNTDKYEIITIYNGKYAATFTTQPKALTYKLIDYKFEPSDKKAQKILVEKD